jgi:hypothetical protein
MVLAHSGGITSVVALLAPLVGASESTLRQRLREWCYDAQDKRGTHRQAVEVRACFAPLLGWVLAWWGSAERRLALVLDASTLSDRFTVLAISVVYRGCAIPVAWQVVRTHTKGAWAPHWKALLAHFQGSVPQEWTVLVLADRGLYARWLYEAIQQCGWHPYLRVNAGGTYRPASGGGLRPLATAVREVGERWCGEVVCFQEPRSRLTCTLVACWEPGHQDRWLVLTDLLPKQAQVAWYALRAWIECGFKDVKRGGWQWHQTKMTDPERASRLWLAMAVATQRARQRRRRGGCDAPSLQPGSVAANPCGSATGGTAAEERTPTQLFSAWAALYHGKVGTGTCLAPWAFSPRTLA